MKKREIPTTPTLFGESGAKRSQDDKPLTHQRLVRTASVNDALWSHPSLRSRRGSRLTATWPLLARLNLAQSIPARPFGLGWRFDETPSGNAVTLRAGSIEPIPRSASRVAWIAGAIKEITNA